LSSFTNGYREKITNGAPWSYAKARNGSYKELIPSHYPLGFLLCNYGRKIHGQNFWDEILIEAAAYEKIIYPFSSAMKKRTGQKTTEFYHEAMDYYADQWNDSHQVNPDSSQIIHVRHAHPNKYFSMRFPTLDENQQLICAISRFDQNDAIYRILDDGKIEKITGLGITTHEPYFHYASGKFTWAERRFHPRWIREDYSTIVVYDQQTKAKRYLNKGSSYFMPSLSPDGKKVAALYDNDQMKYGIHILDSESGNKIQDIQNPENLYFGYPGWTPEGNSLVAAARNESGLMALVEIDLLSGRISQITDFSIQVIGKPAISEKWIIYTSSTEGMDQVFGVERKSGRIFQVTTSHSSKYQPILDAGSNLIYAQYSLKGLKLRKMPFQPSSFIEKVSTKTDLPWLSIEKGETDILSTLSKRSFEERKYGAFSNPVNIHSWGFFADDPIYGIEIRSQNILNTIDIRGGYRYNDNDGSFGPFAEATLGYWYPEIIAGYSGKKVDFKRNDGTLFEWYQHNINGGVRLPFRLTSGKYLRFLSLSTLYNRTSTSGDLNINFNYLSHTLQINNQLIRAYQHPMTRFGQSLVVRYGQGIDTFNISQLHLYSDLALPGPLPNHVLWFQFDYFQEDSTRVRLSDNFQYARGYNATRSDNIYRVGINYHFPLIYPDWGFAGLLYFKRVRVNGFFDYSSGKTGEVNSLYRSAGAEIIFDVQAFNVQPFTFGFRWSRLLDTDPFSPGRNQYFEFFLPLERL
jgi:hypothetical protein